MGFNGNKLNFCWETIKDDVIVLIRCFCNLHTYIQSILAQLCQYYPYFPKKKDGAKESMAKMLSLHLAHRMDELFSLAKSDFIKKRSIHNNFMFVRKQC
jgi:hypothetical protein